MKTCLWKYYFLENNIIFSKNLNDLIKCNVKGNQHIDESTKR